MIVRLFLLLCGPLSVAALAATRPAAGGGFGAAAKASSVVVVDASPTIARLRDFLKQNKADVDHVQVGDATTHGRGLFARKSFTKQGKIICKIPSDCALALSDPAAQGKDVPTVAHNGANFLKLYLQDSAKRAQWAPYLETLPTEAGVSATPDFLADEEIGLLEFPPLVKAVRERKEQIAQVATAQGYSVEEVQFASWLVSSRSFPLAVSADEEDAAKDDEGVAVPSIEVDDRGQVLAKADRAYIRVMLPWLDMANHDSNAPNARITILDPHKEAAWFALEVLRPIQKGQEILVAYGSGVDSSVELLQNYGFVPEKNRMDYLMLRHLHQQAEKDPTVQDFPLAAYATSLEEDEKLLAMAKEENEPNLTKILAFRVQLKQSYPSVNGDNA